MTQGSTVLLQTLFATDLVDELHLLVFPLVLGKGKRLFGDGAVRTGSFGPDLPSDAEPKAG